MRIETTETGARISFNMNELVEPGSVGIDPFDAGSDTHFLIKSGGNIRCYRNICPHLGHAPLAWRKDRYLTDQGQIHCGVHGALFEADTGLCVVGPCIGQGLETYPVSISENEATVFIPAIK